MKLATFKPKAFWMVLEGISQTKTKGGIHIPESAQNNKLFKILKAGSECGPDVQEGGYTLLENPAMFMDQTFIDNPKDVKLVNVHNAIGFWPADEDISEWFKPEKKKVKLITI